MKASLTSHPSSFVFIFRVWLPYDLANPDNFLSYSRFIEFVYKDFSLAQFTSIHSLCFSILFLREVLQLLPLFANFLTRRFKIF